MSLRRHAIVNDPMMPEYEYLVPSSVVKLCRTPVAVREIYLFDAAAVKH